MPNRADSEKAHDIGRLAEFLADLRTAAVLARDGDWCRLRSLFVAHGFQPLAALANAASDALLSLPLHEVGPAQILALADSRDRELVAVLLAIFGVPT